jgi:RNA polymerase sigma-70 factor (ECF subfamily)
MFSRDVTLTDIDRLDRAAAEAIETFQMDEDTFRAFYDRTAASVWAYLFRIATNRAHDRYRRRRGIVNVPVPAEHEPEALVDAHDVAGDAERRTDLGRAMAQLKLRERELLWLAYGHGASHEEIAESLGLRKSSIKMLLFRARRRLAAVLGGGTATKGTPA